MAEVARMLFEICDGVRSIGVWQ